MSRTNVVLDDKLVEKCQKATGIKTRKSLIDYALHEVLRHENQKKLLELKVPHTTRSCATLLTLLAAWGTCQ